MADFVVNVKVGSDGLTPQLRAQATAAKQAEQAQQAAAKAAVAANAASAAAARKAADAQIKESVRVVRENAKHDAETAAGKRKLDEQIARMRDKTARDMERQSARDEARDARVAERRARGEERANERAAAAKAKAEGRALTDEEVAQRVRSARMGQANKARIDAAKKVAGVEVVGNKQADASTISLIGSVKGAALAYAGLRGSVAIMNALGDATRGAADEQKRQADEYIRFRDAQAEIRGMNGKTANHEAVLEAAKFGVDTGMTGAETKAFRTAFEGSGAQYADKFGKREYDKFQTKSAQLAIAKGIDPATIGDLAGTMTGAKDYGKMGNKASETALEDINQSMSILAKGRGDNAVMANQLSMTIAGMVNEDELKGVFNSPQEASIALSTMAEFDPAASYTHLSATKRALRDFDDKKAAPLLQEAGITPGTDYFEAIEKLGPVVRAKAKERGDESKIYDILKESFTDDRGVRGLETAINKGIGEGGIFQQRRKYIAEEMPAGAAQQLIDESRNDPNGNVPDRIADAKLAQANLIKGKKTSTLETMLKDAKTRLIDENRIGTRVNRVDDALSNMTRGNVGGYGFGVTDATQARQYREVAEQLKKTGAKAGVQIKDEELRTYNSEEVIQARYNAIIKRIEAKGFNAETGEPIPASAKAAAAAPAPGPQAALGKFGAGMGGLGGMMAASAMGAMPGGIPEVFPNDGFGGGSKGDRVADLLGEIRDMMAENQRYIRMATGGGDRAQAPPPPPAPPRVISAPVGR